jgi:hypothetical protein
MTAPVPFVCPYLSEPGHPHRKEHGLKPNYQYEKRQRELEKKKKKAEKEQKRASTTEAPPLEESAETTVPPENK